MDIDRTVPEIARSLGVSVPRLHRLLDAEGVPPAGGRGHPRRVDRDVVRRLAGRIGAVPVFLPGFDRTDMLVLAAVARAPLGLASTRAVARAAGVSPTTAGATLARLQGLGLVTRRERRVVQGQVRSLRYWVAALLNPAWTNEVLAAANAVVLPVERSPVSRPPRVPPRFGHAFWNAALGKVDPAKDADFVAARLLQLEDAAAWTWAARHLPTRSLRRAVRARGVDAATKDTVENLIAYWRAG